METGRPTIFNEDIQEKILKMAETGLTDKQVAYIVGVTEQTINNWKLKHPAFFESLKIAKELSDLKVVNMLYRKASGGLTITEKHEGVDATGNIIDKTIVKELPPSDTAAIFWLKNRQPDKWRDKVEQEITQRNININIDSDDKDL